MKKLIVILLLLPSILLAQDAKKYLREGNTSYKDGNMENAGEHYQKALDAAPENKKAIFNMGDALYRQEKFAEAAQQFEMATSKIEDASERAAAWHNYGNSMIQSQEFGKGVDAYKKALMANPKDEDTRYNLAYAQQKLVEQQQQEKQDKDDENEDKKDGDEKEDQEKKDGDKDKDGDQEKKDPQDNNEPKDEPGDPQQLSKQDAERLLNALNNEEKKVQDKVKKKQMKVTTVKVEKDW